MLEVKSLEAQRDATGRSRGVSGFGKGGGRVEGQSLGAKAHSLSGRGGQRATSDERDQQRRDVGIRV